MISGVFTEEKNNMKVLINAKNSLQNFRYRLENDLNVKSFLESLIENIENYDSLERMKKYDFDRDFEEMNETLHLFCHGLRVQFEDVDSLKMAKCCNIFPDHHGKEAIILLSYLPIIELFKEKISYEKALKEIIEDDIQMQSWKEHQESLLNKQSLFFKKFPKDEVFVSYELKNKFLLDMKNTYENGRRDEINSALSILISLYKDSSDLRQTRIQIGSTYWDGKMNIGSKNAEQFKKAFLALSESFDRDTKEKLDRLALVLKDEFGLVAGDDILELIITKQDDTKRNYFIEFQVKDVLQNEKIAELLKIFVIKKDYECTGLSLIENMDSKKFKLSCKIEI